MTPAPAAASADFERLQTAVEAAGVGTWDLDLVTDTLTWSARCKVLFGLPATAQVTYQDFVELVHPDDREATTAAVAQALDPSGPGAYDIEYRTRWQEPGPVGYWVRATGRAFFDETRTQALRFIGTITDLTGVKQSQAQLRQQAADFTTLADSITQLAWMADASGHIFWYNQRWYAYTGTTLEQMQGWGWQQVHHPDYVAGVVERIGRAFATGEAWEDTFPLRGQDGHYRWFLSRAVPLRDAQGQLLRWFGTNTDVTDMQQLQEQLTRSYQDLEVKVTFRTLELEREVQQLRQQLGRQASAG